jgi:V/A-type H+-transporting ATPase subunit I
MIVPMKRLTVLVLENDRDAALEYLREIGVVHVEAVRTAETDDVEAARKAFDHVNRALEVLPTTGRSVPSGRSAIDVVQAMWRLVHARKEIAEETESLSAERLRILPFGDFEPAAVKALAATGVFVRLYQGSPKEPVAAPGGAILTELSRTKHAVYFSLIHRGEVSKLPAQEVRLPAMSLSAIGTRLAELESRAAALRAEAETYAGDRPAVAAIAAEAEDRLRLAEARAGMGEATSRIVYLRGFCPAEDVGCIHEAAATCGWGVIDEAPGDEDAVPTLIRSPRWVRPIEPLMTFIGILPGYRELDIGGMFLVFFGLFFAMLVGDAGYGALFLGASFWARRKYRDAPRKLFNLIDTMAVATIVWGVITGVFFGIHPKAWPLTVTWLEDEENVKRLCFVIAVVHLSLAHLWNIVRMGRSLQSLAQVGWLCTTWTMFFYANKMVLGDTFPSFMGPVFVVGVVLIVFFMTPIRQLKAEWFNHAMLPLNLVSNFVDVVSYIRLFAVGTASFAVAHSFNTMLAPMFGSWATGLIAALFLFLAHALNVVLALMGVMVHGVRLNTLEFSGHIGLQWTGVPYHPFRQSRDAGGPEA